MLLIGNTMVYLDLIGTFGTTYFSPVSAKMNEDGQICCGWGSVILAMYHEGVTWLWVKTYYVRLIWVISINFGKRKQNWRRNTDSVPEIIVRITPTSCTHIIIL